MPPTPTHLRSRSSSSGSSLTLKRTSLISASSLRHLSFSKHLELSPNLTWGWRCVGVSEWLVGQVGGPAVWPGCRVRWHTAPRP